MAKNKSKSGLAGKLGSAGKQAVKNVRGDETDFGSGGDLPAGIEGGIAQLTACYFKQYKEGDMKGEYFFAAQGTVVSPKDFKGQRIEGSQTRIGPEPMCDTPNRSRATTEAHMGHVLNELRKLGVETGDLDLNDLEAAAAAIAEQMPYFTFRTWVGKKQTTGAYKDVEPRVNHVWGGECSFEAADDDDDVDDDTDDDDDDDDDDEEVESADDSDSDDDADEDDDSDSDADSLIETAKRADQDSEKAQKIISKAAKAAGLDEEDYDDWVDVAKAIEAAGDEEDDDDDEDEDEEDEYEPSKGDIVTAKPPKKKKAVECEITKVTKSKRTCSFKTTSDGKLYKGVSWDKIVGLVD